MIGRALGKMADGMAEAAGTLRELLTAESESVRLGAARSLLELGVKLRESVELEERLAALERRTPDDTQKPAQEIGSGLPATSRNGRETS
jgi:hypothetical protein